jgi:integrase
MHAKGAKMTSTQLTTIAAATQLAETQIDDATAELLSDALSENTKRAYRAQLKVWLGFCQRRGLCPRPATPASIAMWITERLMAGDAGGKRGAKGATGASLATIRAGIAAVKAAHEAADIKLETSHRLIRDALRGARKRKPEVQLQAAPIRAELLVEVMSNLGSSPRDRRDAALLALGYVFARRSSEVVGLDYEQLGSGDGFLTITATELTVTLLRHKTQGAEPLVIRVLRAGNELAASAVEQWIALAGVKPGESIIRQLRKGEQITRDRISTKTVTNVIQARVEAHYLKNNVPAHIAARDAKAFSGHSLRHGVCTAAAEAGASIQAIMSLSGHKSIAIASRYVQQADKLTLSPHRLRGVGLGK